MLRETIINKKPFESFEIYCEECDETIFTKDDIVEKSDAMTEAFLCHKIETHSNNTGHFKIGGVINPRDTLQRIDTTVTVST